MDIWGRVLDDKYRIERQLSGGGMGTVFAATHLGTERRVAVKVIAPEFMSNPEFVERFRREAKAAGRLQHPNVVNVTDFGFAAIDADRVAYLAMEYLDGCTLAEVLTEEKRLPPLWVADIVEQICSAMSAAHQVGIIHRDLKPDNIWLEPNRRGGYTVKVLDFGLAKLGDLQEPNAEEIRALPALTPEAFSAQAIGYGVMTETATVIQPARSMNGVASGAVTHAGMILGTPLYMSPEQCRGETPDVRSDIYSLGVIAYQMLTGVTPFVGDLQELLRRHVDSPPPPLRTLRRKIPRDAERVVMSALEKDPARRPCSAGAFACAFRSNIEGVGPLLRQAVAFYGQHFQTFLQLSLLVTSPLLLIKICQWVFPGPEIARIEFWSVSVSLSALTPLDIFIEFFITPFLTVGAFASVTAQLVAAPLRLVKMQSVFQLLKRRWRSFLKTATLYYTCLVVGYALGVVPGLIASFWFILYPMIVIMETADGWRALRRSASLVARIRNTALIVTTVNFLASTFGSICLQVALRGVKGVFQYQVKGEDFSFNFDFKIDSANEVSAAIIGVAVGPLLGIISAMLYFKARQAGGETLSETLAEFAAENFPRAKWREKMDAASVSN